MKIAPFIAFAAVAAVAFSVPVLAQPKPANQITQKDMQAAMERQMHVTDAATVANCASLHPDLARKIDKNWQANLASLPPQVTEYSKSPAFASAVADARRDQMQEARKPEGQKSMAALCKAMAE